MPKKAKELSSQHTKVTSNIEQQSKNKQNAST